MKHPPIIIALQDELAGSAKNASILLMAGVVLILLIACTNVANLLIARTADRAVELSTRSAMGASRARLSRQLLTECMLLSLAATLAGVIVALWTTSIAARLQPAPLASQAYSILDGRVIGFVVGVSILSGLLFGVLPSLYGGRVNALGSRGSSAPQGSRLIREALAAGQVMLTIVLLAASVSVGRAFVNLMRIDRGFDFGGLITVNVLPRRDHPWGERSPASLFRRRASPRPSPSGDSQRERYRVPSALFHRLQGGAWGRTGVRPEKILWSFRCWRIISVPWAATFFMDASSLVRKCRRTRMWWS